MKALAAMLAAVMLSGCAFFDSPFYATGAGITTTDDPAFIKWALETERQLNSTEMTNAICAAGADTPACWARGRRP